MARDQTIEQLMLAIYSGDTAAALRLIKPGLPFDVTDQDHQETPLLAAIRQKNAAVFAALLDAGASAAAGSYDGQTPLHIAARRGDAAMVEILLARGADLHARMGGSHPNRDGRTVLMDAVIGKNFDLVKLLIARGADLFAKDAAGLTALDWANFQSKRIANHLRKAMPTADERVALDIHDAARAGVVGRLRELVDAGTPVDLREQTGHRGTPLHAAALAGHVEAVQLLIERGADVNAREEIQGQCTVLHRAIGKGRAPIVRLLIAHGADVNARTTSGLTPFAMAEQDSEVVAALLDGGTDPNAVVAAGGVTAFLYACMVHKPEVLARMLDLGADLHARADNGHGALDFAATNRPPARTFIRERLGLAQSPVDRLREHVKQWPQLAKQPKFQTLAARLGTIFNRTPAPWKRRKGAIYFHDVSLSRLAAHYGESEAVDQAHFNAQLHRNLPRLQDEVRAEGATLIYTNAIPEEGKTPMVLLPTVEPCAAPLVCGTNNANQGGSTDAVVAWLLDMAKNDPFLVVACGHDFLHGRLLGRPQNAEALSAAMIAFCPDMVDQAGAEIRLQSRPAQIRMLARHLEENGGFFFWWD
jgi:ankyrin repeat protein